MKQSLKKILPGFALSFIIAIFSKIIALWIPSLGAATIAIIIGIIMGNTLFNQPFLNSGTKLAESKLLELAIVLLGATVTFQTIAKMGLNSLIFIILQMTITIFGVYWIGKKLHFSTNMCLLMAGGNAICGSSAIGAIAPEIRSSEEEKGQAIILVNLLGTLLMLLLPLIATELYSETFTQSALIGGTLQSVGQVIASANIVGPKTVEFATLFKIMRIILLVVVVLCFGKFSNKDSHLSINSNNLKPRKLPLPWYIIGFLCFCTLNSLFTLPSIISSSAHLISNWFEIIALAAIGLRLNFSKFFKEGIHFLMYGLAIGLLQISLAICLIKLLHV